MTVCCHKWKKLQLGAKRIDSSMSIQQNINNLYMIRHPSNFIYISVFFLNLQATRPVNYKKSIISVDDLGWRLIPRSSHRLLGTRPRVSSDVTGVPSVSSHWLRASVRVHTSRCKQIRISNILILNFVVYDKL